MKDVLIRNRDVEVRKSPKHGYGVFATKNLQAGDIIDECRFIYIPYGDRMESLGRYLYKVEWDAGEHIDPNTYWGLPIGWGSQFNSSANGDANIAHTWDKENYIMIYTAGRDINKNEELTMKYEYWEDNRYHIPVTDGKS